MRRTALAMVAQTGYGWSGRALPTCATTTRSPRHWVVVHASRAGTRRSILEGHVIHRKSSFDAQDLAGISHRESNHHLQLGVPFVVKTIRQLCWVPRPIRSQRRSLLFLDPYADERPEAER